MDDENQFLRYAVPGIAAVLIFLAALVVTLPGVISALLAPDGRIGDLRPWTEAVGLALAGLVASGGLGFILAQIYFALPSWFNTADHRKALGIHRPSSALLHPCQENRSRLAAHRKARLNWSLSVADTHKELEALTNLCARRMASIGATLVGVALAIPVWVVAIVRRPCGVPSPTALAVLGGAAVLLVPVGLLWWARRKVRVELEEVVRTGLALAHGKRRARP